MFFIPELGTKIKNPDDWTFSVIVDHRNMCLFEAENVPFPTKWTNPTFQKHAFNKTFPKDSIFQIDRIYVRKGAEEWSSVSLFILETTDPKFSTKKRAPFSKEMIFGRFFCPLDDFNRGKFVKVL